MDLLVNSCLFDRETAKIDVLVGRYISVPHFKKRKTRDDRNSNLKFIRR